ncbi:MAG: penicillin-binding protein 1C [Bacteroidetes bacterium]|nr:penicillin-binding protein 1C [Bacteroidota bacterium]
MILKLVAHRLLALVSIPLLLFLSFLALNFLFPLRDAIHYSTVVLDNKGEVIHAFLTPDDKWRMKVELSEISPLLRQTLIEKEDKYFFRHLGVNPIAMFRALFNNVKQQKRTSGASTITMQVARMLEPKQRTYFNKLREVFRALQLEWKYSKEEILQLYFNLVPYGSNIEGVKSVSVLYFNKSPQQLSLAEVTALSIIPNRPSSLKLGINNDMIVLERNKWLKRFEAVGLFDAKTIAESMDEPLSVERSEAPKRAAHLALKLKSTIPHTTIKTFLQLQMQSKVEKLVSDYTRNLSALGIENASVIITDNATGQVITYIGSADFFNDKNSGQVNGAAAVRQPGSTLKPFIYGLNFDLGFLTPKFCMTDVPITINGFQPENYDEQFHGYVTTDFALKNSLNIPAVKALNNIGVDALVTMLKKCNFRQVAKDEKKLGLSLALGGCGVSLEEMTALYSALARKGKFKPLVYCEQLKQTAIDSMNIITPQASYMLTDILSKYDRTDMPVAWSQSANTPKIAWKTGTSYGRRDAWSIGYNQKYTVGVWVGNFSGVGVPELNGAAIATPLLFNIFNTIDHNSAGRWFDMPESYSLRIVCAESGNMPGPYCEHQVMDAYIPLVSSTKVCERQKEIMVSADEKISYCKNCQPQSGFKKKIYDIVSPEMQFYFEQKRMAYQQVPAHNPSCDRVITDGGPAIRYPVHGSEYLISKTSPEPLQLTCDAGSNVRQVFWYVNNKMVKQCSPKEAPFIIPDEGKLKISCTDDHGRNTDIRITVKYVSL